MAFNPQVFRTRALTALVFVAVMLSGLLWSGWSFFLLFTIIHFGCWFEYRRLMTRIFHGYGGIPEVHFYAVTLTGWCLMILAGGEMLKIGERSLTDLPIREIFFIMLLLSLATVMLAGQGRSRNLAISLFGLAYISASWALLIHLRSGQLWMSGGSGEDAYRHFMDSLGSLVGYVIPLVTIATIWINDTMAYLVGSFIGKRPLSPISPKKTWEGTIGGFILAILASTGLYYISEEISLTSLLVLTGLVILFGTLGDLVESLFKRSLNLKDSGSILPGHGGILDRFDTILISAPFVFLHFVFLITL